jgi:2'-5' RNA ligase
METDMLASYAIAEYTLAIEPPAALVEKIKAVKKQFAEKYDCPSALKSRSQIVLIRFQQYEMLERKILHRLQVQAAAQHSFIVELTDFGSLPTHSIFIHIRTKTQITELVKSFRPMQQLLKIDKDRKPHFITDPYINIAVKLLPWQYEKGWLELSNTPFSGRFVAEQLVLLRRRAGEGKYETLKKFQLLNERVTITQGALFT